MTRALVGLAALSLCLAATPLSAQNRGPARGYANPSAVVAAEIAFAKLAQDKGQWTAFRSTATKDAIMFVPQIVAAQDYLKGKADPAKSVTWQPHQVWTSCDGTLAVTRGAWQGEQDKSGYFTTVWQQQKDGKYKWVADMGEPLPMPLDPPEMISAKVADCPPGYRGKPAKAAKAPPAPLDPAKRGGRSLDGTLSWDVAVEADGARRFVVAMASGGQMTTVQDLQVEAPAK